MIRSGLNVLEMSLARMSAAVVAALVFAAVSVSAQTPYMQWEYGPSQDDSFFPLAVWLQDPSDAEEYASIGINCYVGLWKGPTEEQLAALKKAGMKVICSQNKVGLAHIDDPVIVGWMHGDEPDNAQGPVVDGKWQPPILPEVIVGDYGTIRRNDPSRPVLLNLGQGVAWSDWVGRGVRRNHPEDYPKYVLGGDIVSFDVYPVASDRPDVHDRLWFVARGVERLRTWSDGKKIVWNCIETTRINGQQAATPDEIRAEIWMSIIHGSQGIIYFVHTWKPEVDSRRLLHDPERRAAVADINRTIHDLAPVLNEPTMYHQTEVEPSRPEIPVAVMTKRYGNETWVFAVPMREGPVDATFLIGGIDGATAVEVVGENRSIPLSQDSFTDHFDQWDVHIYRIKQ